LVFFSLIGEKVLVFSQWTSTLDQIEFFLNTPNHYLHRRNEAMDEQNVGVVYKSNIDYYRLDGQTSSKKRFEMMQKWNSNQEKNVVLFLLSTKAGGLGINLTGATRVILFDVCWNPSHDWQSVCRAYRYGQKHPVHVYRLVQGNALEEKIWNRCCAKVWVAKHIVDDNTPERFLLRDDLDLFTNSEFLRNERFDNLGNDFVLDDLIEMRHELNVLSIVEHESLFREYQNDKLTEEELEETQKEYEKLLLAAEIEESLLSFQNDQDQQENHSNLITNLFGEDDDSGPDILEKKEERKRKVPVKKKISKKIKKK